MKKEITLHEAMRQIISKLGPMKTKQLAWYVNSMSPYIKRDSSAVDDRQIYARAKKYEKLFEIDENKFICLK